jgi:hypothetical protein
LYFIDASSFSTTRLYDFANKDHLYDIVKIIAFLIGPSENLIQSWRPDLTAFATRITKSDDDQGKDLFVPTTSDLQCNQPRAMDLEQVSRGNQEGKLKPREHRWKWDGAYDRIFHDEALFGRRTTVWTGMTCADNSPRQPGCDPIETVIKAAWLPPSLRWHEHKMLNHLNPKQAFKPSSRFAKLDEETKREVYEHLPTSIGLLDADMKTSQIPPKLHGSQNAFAPPSEHLELVVLGIHGPIGAMVDREFLSIIELSEVHLGTCAQHWYNATRDVHFRDTSAGNVVYRRVKGNNNTKTRGKIVGFLIDYGNARYQNEKRNPWLAGPWEGLCADDLRSGTPEFLCTAVLETDTNLDIYNDTKSQLQSVPEDNQRRRKQLLKECAQAEANLTKNRHRFIDDLESDLYVFIYQVSLPQIALLPAASRSFFLQAAHPSRMSQADLQTLRTTLRDPRLKMVAWKTLLFRVSMLIISQEQAIEGPTLTYIGLVVD